MADNLNFDHPKARFCPSPTGLIHLGNARTALFNALFSLKYEGTLLLRIEDTDQERSDERYVAAVVEDLLWLGIDWQEGIEREGDFGPYRQSNRQAVYDDYYQRLVDAKIVYSCFCTEEELAKMRRLQRAQGKPPRYAGTCRDLTEEQIKAKIEQGLTPTLRFRVPENEPIEFDDMVKGHQRMLTDDISDFIIQRSDGTPPFMFCNAVDDALMEVTHVIRGEDHVTNTPRQILILHALGLDVPVYGHVALIMGNDDAPLSKRNGSQSIEQLRERGYLAGAIINYLARLGHFYGHDEYLSLQELAEQFEISKLNKSPARFNIDQLNFWQKQAVEHLDYESFWQWVSEDVRNKVPESMQQEFFEAVKPNVHFPTDVEHWSNVIFGDRIEIQSDVVNIIEKTDQQYFSEMIRAVKLHGGDLRKIIEHLKYTLQVEGRELYQPMRVALTGELHGPELEKILHLMDQGEIKRRLESAK